MNNARAILWLFVITLAAVAANVFLSWRAPAVRRLQRRTLLDSSFDPKRIEIDRADAPKTVLGKTDKWRLVRPYAGAADAQVVLRLVDRLTVTPIEASLSNAELAKLGRMRDELGLDAPKARLELSDDKETVSVSFGQLTPTSNGVYVAVGGSDSVFVVPASVREAADLGADAFRKRDVFSYGPDAVLDFDLRAPGETPLSFVRDGDGWQVGDTAASAAKVRDFLSRLTETSAVEFFWPVGATNEETVVSESRLVGYGLDAASALAITLRCRDGMDRRILIGDDAGNGKTYALIHNGSAIVSIDSALKAAVLEGTRSFVDARLFPLEESSVLAFTLTDGDVSYVVARADEGSWRLDAPIVAPADSKLATSVLSRILALTPSDLTDSGIKVSVSTNREPCVVSAKAVLGDARFEDLRSSEILRVDAALVKRLVSTSGGKKARPSETIVYSRERKAWNADGETDGDRAVNERAVAKMLAALSPLTASGIVTLTASAADLPRYGLEQPFHTVAVDQEKDGAVRRNIFIGAETKGGRYATVGSAEAVFVLPKKTVEALVAPLFEE